MIIIARRPYWASAMPAYDDSLGFARAQAREIMVAAGFWCSGLGNARTIGAVSLLAIMGRRLLGDALTEKLPQVERWVRVLQSDAGTAIILVAGYAIFTRV